MTVRCQKRKRPNIAAHAVTVFASHLPAQYVVRCFFGIISALLATARILDRPETAKNTAYYPDSVAPKEIL